MRDVLSLHRLCPWQCFASKRTKAAGLFAYCSRRQLWTNRAASGLPGAKRIDVCSLASMCLCRQAVNIVVRVANASLESYCDSAMF